MLICIAPYLDQKASSLGWTGSTEQSQRCWMKNNAKTHCVPSVKGDHFRFNSDDARKQEIMTLGEDWEFIEKSWEHLKKVSILNRNRVIITLAYLFQLKVSAEASETFLRGI